jgi:hypothetical protein
MQHDPNPERKRAGGMVKRSAAMPKGTMPAPDEAGLGHATPTSGHRARGGRAGYARRGSNAIDQAESGSRDSNAMDRTAGGARPTI